MQYNRKITGLHLLGCLLLVQSQFWSNANGSQTINEATANTLCLYQEHNITYQKELGAVWFPANDPCLVYTCAAGVGETPQAHMVETRVDCSEFYCEVGSELRKYPDSCCGECVQTHCRDNNTLRNIGESWHNEADCTILECRRLENGDVIINKYKRDCPPVPANCPSALVETFNCCPICRALPMARDELLEDTDPTKDTWTQEFYRQHPCVRNCQVGAPPMTCHYKFVVEWYETLSKACYNCPQNVTDCERPHCVIADGLIRSITVVNRMMPGPAIEVCEGDNIVVDVKNNLLGESTTIHWHGLHQRHSPYMDGTPHITQCPIPPHATFRYNFKADNAGTHFWHSHTGMQRGDGVLGALIIRRPRFLEPHGGLYDMDLPEHVMIVQDWVSEPGTSTFANHHHSRGDNKPHTVLINGRGRFYNQIWQQAKEQLSTFRGSVTTKSPQAKTQPKPSLSIDKPSTNRPQPNMEVDIVQPLEGVQRISFKQGNELSRLARLASPKTTRLLPMGNDTSFSASQPRSRQRRGNLEKVPLEMIPLQVYNVRFGFRYRFRIINAEFLNCPVVVSIDDHNLTAISSDSYDFEPVEVGSIVTYAGERFDFVVKAFRPIGNYWVRLKGLMDCDERFTSAFQVAILRYEGAPSVEPSAPLSYGHKAPGIELNVMNRGPGYPDTMTVAELRALPLYDMESGIDTDTLVPKADYKFFVYYDFYRKDNPEFHDSEYYGFEANVTSENRIYTPQLNHISLKFPSMTLLSDRNKIDDSLFCNETGLLKQGIDCRQEFCKCHHVLQVPLNAIVELIIVDEGLAFYANHPFHLHGNAFRVLGLERLGENVTIEMIKQLDQFNLLKRNLVNPPVKDTVTVPDGGYTIIRFEASNPGFWLFHCHIEFHAEIGMALVFKVGDNNQMAPVPKNFPACGDYMPELHDGEDGVPLVPDHDSSTTAVPPAESRAAITLSSLTLLLLSGIGLVTEGL